MRNVRNTYVKCENALIAIGSNLPGMAGNPFRVCNSALDACESPDVRILRRARWRRSPAFPPGSGPEFVNGAALVETTLSASDLLSRLHDVEAEMGRVRRVRWGPRVCDIDLIAYGDLVAPDSETVSRLMQTDATAGVAPDQMILPHPRMHERAFVLAPLADVAPDWRHPVTKLTVGEMLASLPQAARDDVTIIEESTE